VLLLLDNQESHLSIPVIDYCKDNGVVLLSFLPHCSHQLQPLDLSVYGPLKKFINSASDAWLKNNPGKTVTIYDIPEIVKQALLKAATSLEDFRRQALCSTKDTYFQKLTFCLHMLAIVR